MHVICLFVYWPLVDASGVSTNSFFGNAHVLSHVAPLWSVGLTTLDGSHPSAAVSFLLVMIQGMLSFSLSSSC